MFILSTRMSILDLVGIGCEMSEKFEVSDHLCESCSSSFTVWKRDGMERGISALDVSLVRGVTTKSCLDRNIWKSASMSGGSTKHFSIENPGACPRRACDGWVGTSRSVVPLNLEPCHRSVILGAMGG